MNSDNAVAVSLLRRPGRSLTLRLVLGPFGLHGCLLRLNIGREPGVPVFARNYSGFARYTFPAGDADALAGESRGRRPPRASGVRRPAEARPAGFEQAEQESGCCPLLDRADAGAVRGGPLPSSGVRAADARRASARNTGQPSDQRGPTGASGSLHVQRSEPRRRSRTRWRIRAAKGSLAMVEAWTPGASAVRVLRNTPVGTGAAGDSRDHLQVACCGKGLGEGGLRLGEVLWR